MKSIRIYGVVYLLWCCQQNEKGVHAFTRSVFSENTVWCRVDENLNLHVF